MGPWRPVDGSSANPGFLHGLEGVSSVFNLPRGPSTNGQVRLERREGSEKSVSSYSVMQTMKYSLTVPILLLWITATGQNVRTEEVIDKLADDIDHLRIGSVEKVVPEYFAKSFEGAQVQTAYYNKSDIKKYREETGNTFGRRVITIYFENNQPIKIIDSDENWTWQVDVAGEVKMNYVPVWQIEIFILDWERGKFQTREKFAAREKPLLSDYMPAIDRCQKLLKPHL